MGDPYDNIGTVIINYLQIFLSLPHFLVLCLSYSVFLSFSHALVEPPLSFSVYLIYHFIHSVVILV